MRSILLLLTLVCLVGCTDQPQWIAVPGNPPERPPANLPVGMRETNWVSRTNGQGSCVIASSVYHLRWHNYESLAAYFRRTYSGGQTANSIRDIWRRNNIPFASNESGDPDFLEWASRTRRGAIIWYFPSHCVHFCGFGLMDGVEYAFICDNNRVKNYIRIPKRQFLSEWRGYGGFACTALLSPAPTLPTIGYEEYQP